MDWLKKLGDYAPDIVAAISTGGASLGATAIKLVSKELLGAEDGTETEVAEAVVKASPKQLENMSKINNQFRLEAMRIEAAEMQSARGMYSKFHVQADSIANKIMTWNMLYAVIIGMAQILALSFFTGLPDIVILAIGNASGAITKGLLDERNMVCGFYFGSSIGSKTKK